MRVELFARWLDGSTFLGNIGRTTGYGCRQGIDSASTIVVPDCALGVFMASIDLGFLGGFLDLVVGHSTFAAITQRVDHSYMGIEIGQMHSSTDHQDTWANWNLIWTSPLLSFLWFKRWLNAPWRQWIWVFLVASIPLFLMALYLVPQCVSLSSVVLAWAVWLSLDPWKVISRVKILMIPANRK